MGLLLCLNLMLLLDAALGSLPAPVNVIVSSVNFRHVLRWDPGPGTPAGTQYSIFQRESKKERQLQNRRNTTTRLKLKLENEGMYFFKVQAVHKQTRSPKSKETYFSPFTNTKIGPPTVLVVGCGNCIQVNISIPQADRGSGIEDIQAYYGANFKIALNRSGDRVENIVTKSRSLTLDNLEKGREYCVQVSMEMMNTNIVASEWTCTHTSLLEPNRVPVFVGTAAAVVMCLGFFLMGLMYILVRIGLLCKLKAALPRALLCPMHGTVLTLESPSFDVVSLSPEQNGQRKRHNRTESQHPTGGANSGDEDDEEEVDPKQDYMDRNADLSSGESFRHNSCDVSGSGKPAASENAGSLSAGLSAEAQAVDVETEAGVVPGGVDEDEAKDEGEEIICMPDKDQTRRNGHIQGEGEEEEEEEEEKKEEEEEETETEIKSRNLGNINLFSVTLGLLERDKDGAEEEEEEEQQSTRDSVTDLLKQSATEPLPPTDSRWTLSHSDSPVDDLTPLLLTLPALESEHECRHADRSDASENCAGDEEEEEEEEDSGYVGRSLTGGHAVCWTGCWQRCGDGLVAMTPLRWMLMWLPQVLPAQSDLPRPANVILTSYNFIHVLRWEPGPGSGGGVHYNVSVHSERGTSWEPVTGCQQVRQPLVCNLTEALSDPRQLYYSRVVALRGGRTSAAAIRKGFLPIKDTELDLPLLSVAPCGRDLCVHLQSPLERLRDVYESLRYNLSIRRRGAVRAEFFHHAVSLKGEVLKDLAPGRDYCVSVRISDSLVPRESNYSRPQCTAAAAAAGGVLIPVVVSLLVCLLLVLGLASAALLVAAGCVCLTPQPLPAVLTFIQHTEDLALFVPCREHLSPLAYVKETPPSTCGKRNSRSSDDSEGESDGDTSGGGYKLSLSRPSALLSSSSSSPPSPLPSAPPSASSNKNPQVLASDSSSSSGYGDPQLSPPPSLYPQPSALISLDRLSLLIKRALTTHTPSKTNQVALGPLNHHHHHHQLESINTELREEEEEAVGGGSGQDVNLLTLTLGEHQEEEEEEEEEEEKPYPDRPAAEPSSAEPSCDANPLLPLEGDDDDEEEEEDDDEEEEECGGYLRRPNATHR
ncbi:uncharacterized protein LOC143004342 [Genypterus blacodes]|uniref:uncharacterized protein LOC143004342 n=1 Tax=Genypterus blacodes TaxID=154954 RepID=UPI003F7719A2